MTQEALKLALEALYFLPALSPEQNESQDEAIEAIKKALRENAMREVQRLGQEIEQEPVAWVNQANLNSAAIQRNRGGQGDTHTWSETPTWDHSVPLYTSPPQLEERNFCQRCGKRTKDIHTCTPPQRTWVGLTDDELTDLFYNTNLGQQSAVAQAIALLEERNT